MNVNPATIEMCCDHVGFDYDVKKALILIPADDYYSTGKYEWKLKVKFHDVKDFGKIGEVGRHIAPLSLDTLSRAIVECANDLFQTIHVYSK